MSTYEWLLFLHVLSAFALVGALVVLGAAILGVSRSQGAEEAAAFATLTRPATTLFSVAGLAVLVFGIWLAFEADYGLDDAWIMAAIVLWLVAAATGERTGRPYAARRDRHEPDTGRAATGRAGESPAPAKRSAVLFAVASASVAAMLVLMIFKPGAG